MYYLMIRDPNVLFKKDLIGIMGDPIALKSV